MLKVNEYFRPETLKGALDLLASSTGKTHLLAGGTDLLLDLRKERQPSAIIDLSRIQALKEIKEEEAGIYVGAMATFAELEASELIREFCPPLARAAASVGSPQIRNNGTIGGNLVKASPAGDSVPPIVAFDGEAILVSPRGERRLPVTQFLKGINKTDLAEDELLIAVYLPKIPGFHWGYSKLGRRKALAISRLSGVVGVELDGSGKVQKARVALGAVAPNPFRSEILEAALLGVMAGDTVPESILGEAAREVEERIGARPSMPYKREGIRGVIREACLMAFEDRTGKTSGGPAEASFAAGKTSEGRKQDE